MVAIALVGCGAIAQRFYVPGLMPLRGRFDRFWAVDIDPSARNLISTTLGGGECGTLAEVPDRLDAVIVATSNDAHFSVACDALALGANVLMEKPFVVWPHQGRELIAAAKRQDLKIVVNQPRRFFPYVEDLRENIVLGKFGALKSICHSEGSKLNWPFSSGAAFSANAERTGVIMDIGVHVVDLLQYLLTPEWNVVSAMHDGFRGPEGLADIQLTADSIPVSIKLSRFYPQGNETIFTFERASVYVAIATPGEYRVQWSTQHRERRTLVSGPIGLEFLANRMLQNFFDVIEGQGTAICDATSSLPTINVLDSIYRTSVRYSSLLGAV